MENKKIEVFFFQRKPRKGFSFSLEYIFDDIRLRLATMIDAKVFISKSYNDGYYSKIVNIIEASQRQGQSVNHVTGEVHFLDFLMNKKRVVLTILDCGMMRRKNGLAKKIVNWLYLSGPIKKARIITAISEETKSEIVGYTNCDPNKIKVIPVAVDPSYQPLPKAFNSENPTILHIGTGPNKNLTRLIEALNGLKCVLVIVGKLSEEYQTALTLNNINYRNEYNIPHERLMEVYKECDILSFVSTFEGFGMPIIEANAVERVVVTSNLSSMPEVAGNAACLVDPFEVSSIREGIAKVIADEDFRNQLIINGRTNKLRFEPQKIAEMYLQIYRDIASEAK